MLDITDFFASVSAKMVNNTLLQNQFSPNISHILTKLLTYNNELPKGSPTSPYLANLLLLPLDKALISICQQKGIVYSRFIDDLTFSAKNDFRYLTKDIIQKVFDFGLSIKREKIKYSERSAEITGIRVHKYGIEMCNAFTKCLSHPELLRPADYKWLLGHKHEIAYHNRIIKNNLSQSL